MCGGAKNKIQESVSSSSGLRGWMVWEGMERDNALSGVRGRRWEERSVEPPLRSSLNERPFVSVDVCFIQSGGIKYGIKCKERIRLYCFSAQLNHT